MIWNKPKKFIKTLLKVLTILSTILTLMTLITFYLWNYKPDFVNHFDKQLVKRYKVSYTQPLLEAKQLKASGQYQEALLIFNTLFERMKDFGKIDRLHSMKRDVIKNIINLNISLEDFDKAKRMAKYWVNSDKKDLDAQLSYLQVLSYDTKMNSFIEKEYSRLIEKFYNVPKVIKSYKKFLIKTKDHQRLAQINKSYNYDAFKGLHNSHEWQLFYTESGSSISADKSKHFTLTYFNLEKKKSLLKALLVINKKDIIQLRIDLPSSIDLEFNNLMLKIKTYEGEIKTINIIKLENLKFHNIAFNNGHMRVTGNDPYLYVNLAEKLNIDSVQIIIGNQND